REGRSSRGSSTDAAETSAAAVGSNGRTNPAFARASRAHRRRPLRPQDRDFAVGAQQDRFGNRQADRLRRIQTNHSNPNPPDVIEADLVAPTVRELRTCGIQSPGRKRGGGAGIRTYSNISR